MRIALTRRCARLLLNVLLVVAFLAALATAVQAGGGRAAPSVLGTWAGPAKVKHAPIRKSKVTPHTDSVFATLILTGNTTLSDGASDAIASFLVGSTSYAGHAQYGQGNLWLDVTPSASSTARLFSSGHFDGKASNMKGTGIVESSDEVQEITFALKKQPE